MPKMNISANLPSRKEIHNKKKGVFYLKLFMFILFIATNGLFVFKGVEFFLNQYFDFSDIVEIAVCSGIEIFYAVILFMLLFKKKF